MAATVMEALPWPSTGATMQLEPDMVD
jgi:hypothetical protein